MSSPKRLAPKDVRTYSQLLRMARTVAETKSSMLHIGHNQMVYLWNKGQQSVTSMSRAEFNRLVVFYQRAQKLQEPSHAK